MLLSQLEYFRVVARHEHISHAAEELCIAQPALSTTISKLEKELGMPLFDRIGRNIELNDAGRRLLEHTDYLFAEIDAMYQSLANIEKSQKTEVVISISNSMFLGNWLHEFVLNHPEIRLHQKMMGEEDMLEALREETIDVAIGEFGADIPGIERKILVEDEYVFSVSENHPLAVKENIMFEDIRDVEIISLPSNATGKIADKVFGRKGCRPNVIFEGDQRMMARLAVQGKGIVFSSKQMMHAMYYMYQQQGQLDEEKKLTVRTIEDIDGRYTLCICWKKDRVLPVMARIFIEEMDSTYPRYSDDENFMQLYGANLTRKGSSI